MTSDEVIGAVIVACVFLAGVGWGFWASGLVVTVLAARAERQVSNGTRGLARALWSAWVRADAVAAAYDAGRSELGKTDVHGPAAKPVGGQPENGRVVTDVDFGAVRAS